MKRKEYNIIQTILIGLLAIVLIMGGFNIFRLVSSRTVKGDSYDKYKNEYYVVGKKPTDYQVEVFKELTSALDASPRDYKEISDLVAQSFVIDFFGWSNKDGAYDVGGLQYMYDPEEFYEVAHYEYYQKVDVFNETFDTLPAIENVRTLTRKADDYIIDDVGYESYLSNVKFDFSDSDLQTNELIDEIELRLIKDKDDKISIVSVKMIDEITEDNEFNEMSGL